MLPEKAFSINFVKYVKRKFSITSTSMRISHTSFFLNFKNKPNYTLCQATELILTKEEKNCLINTLL